MDLVVKIRLNRDLSQGEMERLQKMIRSTDFYMDLGAYPFPLVTSVGIETIVQEVVNDYK